MKTRIPTRTIVIDDDVVVCRSIQGWLLEAAHDVVTFTDPAAGLEHAGANPCHVALIDLRMPQIPGADVIASLGERCPDTRVVAMTAFPETAQVLSAFRSGARDLIEKPIQREQLLAAVDRQFTKLGIAGHTQVQFHQRLGQRLRQLRTERDLKLSDVASQCGITTAQLSQIELGKNGTSTWTLARIAGALRAPLGKLFDGM